MKRSACPSLVAVSLLVALAPAWAAARPRYGGTLRLELSAPLASLDPTQSNLGAPDTATREHLAELIYDRLTRLDANGMPQPQLAVSWEQEADFRRWRFRLRPGVKLHSGSPLLPHLVVMSLVTANPGWRVRASGDEIVVESETPLPNLPLELARARNSIVARGANSAPQGSGAFRVSEWEPGKRLVLAANEDYWAGRPFLDSVEITLGRSLRDQWIDLQLGRADVIEIGPDQARRAAQEGQRVVSSAPAELVGIVFSERPAVQDTRLREALSLCVDRSAIQATLLQRQGEAAGGLLPQWVSGYAFLFPTGSGLERAQQLRRELSSAPNLTLAFDWGDPILRAVAERASVNARDAGITVQVFGENFAARMPSADMRVVRLPLTSPNPTVALQGIAGALGRADLRLAGGAPEDLYAAERSLRQDFRFVPIVYLPEAFGLSLRVRNWVEPRQGGLPLENVWLETAKP